MLSTQHIEESLSISYVNAIVACAGHVFESIHKDYGVDGSVRRIEKRSNKCIDLGAAFECQLKATINWDLDNGSQSINYDMDVDAYNRLVLRNNEGTLPCYLILLCLPKENKNWLSISPDQLIIRKCCYYYLLNGIQTSNLSSKRIKIPAENIFNCEVVSYLINDPFRSQR